MTEKELKSAQDTFVVVVPTSWDSDVADLIVESYENTWFKSLKYETREHADADWVAELRFEDGGLATVVAEEPMPELTQLAGMSYEPYAASDLVLLKEHVSTHRIVVEGGADDGSRAAMRAAELMSAWVEAGAHGAFIPQAIRLHSPRTVRSLAADLPANDALANIFVNAWHDSDWMRSRGLTAFGLPELETPTTDGLNGAYFRIMDVAANMIRVGRAYPPGAQLEVGPQSFRLEIGPKGLQDDPEVPVCGHFGVRSIMPKP